MSGGTSEINKKWWPKVEGGSHEYRPIVMWTETGGITGGTRDINTATETI